MIPIAKPFLGKEEAQNAYDTILSGWVAQGERVEEFEKKFCEYTGSKFSIAVSNCTNALHLAMIVSGIKTGDEVICPSMSYIATANSIVYTGAEPVFAEVSQHDYNLDPEHVKKLITKKTKAVLLVHQIGMPADIEAFQRICKENNLKLIEDAACAIGSEYKGEKIGVHSELVCFSFHPRKVITTGEGGMITTYNKEYYKRLKLLRQHAISISGKERHISENLSFEDHLETGYNYRMTDIQAAIGVKQLDRLDKLIEERRRIAGKYITGLSGIDCIKLPAEPEDRKSNFQSFAIYLKENSPLNRNELMQKLLAAGISVRKGVMTSHRESAYKNSGDQIKLTVSEDLCDNSFMIPLYVPMDESDINYVIETIRKIVS
ncbi:MAG: DegT/DnrJ/EryC1/StrS family aminotransferase [Ignavibacteria bacterium]|nr:DegT/DnrJ/EryC1/StrS family aminotransferase [Ignavibacteria bacterium]